MWWRRRQQGERFCSYMKCKGLGGGEGEETKDLGRCSKVIKTIKFSLSDLCRRKVHRIDVWLVDWAYNWPIHQYSPRTEYWSQGFTEKNYEKKEPSRKTSLRVRTLKDKRASEEAWKKHLEKKWKKTVAVAASCRQAVVRYVRWL